MITILFHMTVKPERAAEFREVVATLTSTTHAEDAGCLAYAFYTRTDDANQAVLYEQWSDAEALNAHVARLQRDLGEPDNDPSLPERHPRRRLPKSFMDLFESTEAIRYEPVA